MIAGIVAVHNFPLDVDCLLDLLPRVQAVTIWLDQEAASRRAEIKQLLKEHAPHLVKAKIIDSDRKWKKCSGWIWREPLMRSLDDVRPEIVLQPDSDEKFGPGFDADLQAFRESKRDLLLFDYAMPTADGAWVPTCPRARHVKVIRWRPGLSFSPYRGYGKPNGQLSEMRAESKILHYCFFTPEIQAAKVAHLTRGDQIRMNRREQRPPCSTA